MSSPPGAEVPNEDLTPDGPNLQDVIRTSFIKGFAILLPLVVTLLVVAFVFGFIADALSPLVTALTASTVFESRAFVTSLTVAVFLGIVLATGLAAEHSASNRINAQFDEFMASIPGIGSVYTSFDEMTELLMDSDTDSFQDVKLVEYPGKDSYVVAFKTAETPDTIADQTGNEEMITLFMPMAPNPVMGGFVIHVSCDRVVDIDLTVEEGVRSIVTSGVAFGEEDMDGSGISEERLQELTLTPDPDGEESTAPVEDDPRPDRGEYEDELQEMDIEDGTRK